MKQNRGDWTDAVRRSLSETESQLPVGGWERLERELSRTAPVKSEIRSYRSWFKFAAAAAAVLVCVSVGVRVTRSDKNVLERVVMVPEAAVSVQNADMEGVSPFVSGDITAQRESVEPLVPVARPAHREVVDLLAEGAQDHRSVPSIAQSRHQSSSGDKSAASTTNPQSESLNPTGLQPEKGDALPAAEYAGTEQQPTSIEHLAELTGKPVVSELESSYNTIDYDGLFASAEPVSRVRYGGSVAFDAGGVVTSSSGGVGLGPASLLMITDGAASLRDAYEEYTYKHKQPLSFGVTVRKEFAYGLSLESGLTYTLLRSDVTVPGGVRDVSQKLHFVGIPLRLNWEFLRRGGFSLYVGAGGAVEKCVAARFGGEKMTERGVQFSVFGAVGAQYRLGKVVAIYFEPEVSHYLTKTTLRTSYTDSAVNLNLQLGVRFNY